MRPGGSRGSALRWASLLGLLLLAAAAAASLREDGPDGSVGGVIVGDLKLADGDEPPSDGVRRTFVAGNLAPGDARTASLTLVRAPIEDLPPVLEPRVEIRLDPTGPQRALPDELEVHELAYGDRDLLDDAWQACGSPLSLSRLIACTRTETNPLTDLPDPTPEGRSFRLGVTLPSTVSSALEDAGTGFDVRVELYGSRPGPPGPTVLDPERLPTGDDRTAIGDRCAAIRQASARPVPSVPEDTPAAPVEQPVGPPPGPTDPLWSGGPRLGVLWSARLGSC